MLEGLLAAKEEDEKEKKQLKEENDQLKKGQMQLKEENGRLKKMNAQLGSMKEQMAKRIVWLTGEVKRSQSNEARARQWVMDWEQWWTSNEVSTN